MRQLRPFPQPLAHSYQPVEVVRHSLDRTVGRNFAREIRALERAEILEPPGRTDVGIAEIVDLAGRVEHRKSSGPRVGAELYPALGVRGPIELDELGKTTCHEHLIWEFIDGWFLQAAHPYTKSPRPFAPGLDDLPLTLENVGKFRRDPVGSRLNLCNENLELAIDEVSEWKRYGGRTVVDVTSSDWGRDPLKLRTIAERTGLNLIMGGGHYVDREHPIDMNLRTVDQIAESFINDVVVGVDGTGVRMGMLGEIGCKPEGISWNAEKSIRASALAQRETGVPIGFHPPVPVASTFAHRKELHEILDILEEEGADLTHLVLYHMSFFIDTPDYMMSVLDRGCFVSFDRFGNEWYFDMEHAWEVRDVECLKVMKLLVDRGYADQILVAQDVCQRNAFVRYGGYGYGHILKTVIPYMFEKMGLDEHAATAMLVDNPRRLLAFRKPLPV